MTQPASTEPQSTALIDRVRAKIDRFIPAIWREHLYKVVTAIVMALTATGVTSADKAGLWTQLGVATVTLLFALLYAGTGIRAALYSLTSIGAAVLMAYGIAQGVNWAVIVAATGQALGLATAAAKTPAELPDGPSTGDVAGAAQG